MITEPGFHFPLAAASSIMAFAIRSLIAASGIEVFEFAEQVGLQPFALLNRDEIQRRCFPDQLVLKI